MFLFSLSWRNILRNYRRSILTGLSIMFAVAIVIFMWSFIEGEIKAVFDTMINTSSGHIRVVNTKFLKREKMLPLQENIPDYVAIQEMLAKDPNVKTVTGRIRFGVLLENNGTTKQSLGFGIEPQKEEQVLKLGKTLVDGRLISQGSEEEVNIGVQMAKELGLRVGDILTVVTQTAYGSFSAKNLQIVGIFNYGSPVIDKRCFFISLPVAQDLLDISGCVTELLVMTDKPDQARLEAAKIGEQIALAYPDRYTVKAWQDQGVLFTFMNLAKYIYMVILGIVLLLSAFTILNTMFMAVLERTRELGMMKALGLKNGQVVNMMLIESAALGTIASFLGAIFGTILSYYMSVRGMDFTKTVANMETFPIPNVLYAHFSWSYVLIGFSFGILFSVLAAIPPALRAAKMEATEALHEI
ncbi:MAG: FtsX-like permease family protein [Candidatus Margulisiibacteriota bacterium]|jgi:putative ABC transport system permease protein